jgi:hypothetical protein
VSHTPNLVAGAPATAPARHRSAAAGLLPLIGPILFVVATIHQFAGGAGEGWGPTLVQHGVFYLIGWSGFGAGIAHLAFGKKISRTIGFKNNEYEFEVGAADLAMGVGGLLAASFGPQYWFAIILVSAIFRIVCGVGHIRSMITERNFAVNNTLILFVNFVVPVFLLLAFHAWAA